MVWANTAGDWAQGKVAMGGTRTGRFIGGIAAMTMLFGSILAGTPASAQEEDPIPSTLTATFWECPEGMTADTLVPGDCTLITEGFEASVVTLREGSPLTLADAAFDGTSFTWDPLGYQLDNGDSVPWAFRETVLPSGATSYIAIGDVGAFTDETNPGNPYFPFSSSYDDPDTTIDVYNFVPAAEEPVDSTLSIHQRLCGANNYTGGDPYTECHDWLLGDATEYDVYDADDTYYETASPDPATGNMDFVIPGTQIFITNGASAWSFQNTAEVYCIDTNTGESLETGHSGMGVGSARWIKYPAGANIVCDWYIFSEERDGIYIGAGEPETPTPTPTATATATATATTTVTSLPNTGSGTATTGDSNAWIFAPAALVCAGLFTALHIRRRAPRF